MLSSWMKVSCDWNWFSLWTSELGLSSGHALHSQSSRTEKGACCTKLYLSRRGSYILKICSADTWNELFVLMTLTKNALRMSVILMQYHCGDWFASGTLHCCNHPFAPCDTSFSSMGFWAFTLAPVTIRHYRAYILKLESHILIRRLKPLRKFHLYALL